MRSKGLSNCVGPLVDKSIEIRGYSLQKGFYNNFELFFEGHSNDSVIYDLCELQIQ